MSLKPGPIQPIPEETIQVARAAFPKGNLYLTLRDKLGPIFQDEDFAGLFPADGQPALPPWRLALVTILQFRENLSDRQAAEAVRGRIDWKYLLSLELTDAGFDFSVLSEFRGRLLEGGQEVILLEKLLECCQAQGLIKARGQQRTDATRVLAAIRVLTRLELVGETMRAALNELATVAPDWLAGVVPAEWYHRYSRRIEDRYPIYGAAGYDYMIGQPWPMAYPGYNVPQAYQPLYYDTPQSHYRYADGGIYRVDPTTQIIQALVALVSGQQFGIGQQLPAGYSTYNVPFAYRDRYYDSDDAWYRYADGYVYQVDPMSGLIEESYPIYA